MNIAVCLFGLHPKYCWKDKKQKEDNTYKFWKKNVFEKPYNVDVFLHSWSYEDKDLLINEYNPKTYIIEKQKSFKSFVKNETKFIKSYNLGHNEITYSSMYSLKKSIELMRENEINNDIKYDFVLVARMDILWLVKLDFEKLDNTEFIVPIWGNNNFHSKSCNGVLGTFFLSNSENIFNFRKIYDNLPFFLKDNHSLHIISKFMIDTITDRITYKFKDCHSENPECDKQRDLNNINYNKE
jgi:hypothetical protein